MTKQKNLNTSINEFLNENENNINNISEKTEDVLKVYESKIRDLLSNNLIGEGIDEIEERNENEIVITFIENAWGGISLKEWNKLDKILQELKEIDNLQSYEINPSYNIAHLYFDDDLELELD